jgi:RNA polymerase-binding protein DksA
VRQALTAERRDVVARIDALSRTFRDIVGAALSANADDEHDPEGATIAYERAQTGALRDQALAHLAELDQALERLDDGRYGTCESCGGPIAAARLAARPAARTCVECAARPAPGGSARR